MLGFLCFENVFEVFEGVLLEETLELQIRLESTLNFMNLPFYGPLFSGPMFSLSTL